MAIWVVVGLAIWNVLVLLMKQAVSVVWLANWGHWAISSGFPGARRKLV